MTLVAGVDCSTQSTKVLIVDADDGTVVGEAAAPHSVGGTAGARETNPAVWADALSACVAATGLGGDVAAVSVAGQQHGLVVLDDQRHVLRPAILWNDTRAGTQASALVRELGGPPRCASTVGSVLTPAFTVASWAWLRESEPELCGRARWVCLPHDYLTALLTGGPLVTDRSDASGTGWWSPNAEDYVDEVLSLGAVRLDRSQLPTVHRGDETAGYVCAGAAEAFGLAGAAVVAVGAGDNAAAALGLGLQPGDVAVSLGTSGTVYAVAGRPSCDPTGIVAGFASADGAYLPLACTLNATLAVDSVARILGLDRGEVAPSDGVVFLPWLDGERIPNRPSASGALVGVRHDTDPRSVLQAAYEGAAATLLAALDSLAGWASIDDASPLIVIGGGARSKVWREVIGRLSARPLVVPDASELVALGAAVQAAAAVTGRSPTSVAAAWGTRRGLRINAVDRDDDVIDRIKEWTATVASFADRDRREE